MMDLSGKPFYLSDKQIGWVKSTLQSMTPEEKAGQLFCIMGGDYTPEQRRDLVKKGRVGGILFRPATSEKIREWFHPLDETAKIPLLKAANLEEGGSGGATDGTLFGWPMMVAAANDELQVKHFAQVCGVEGQRIGVNWTFSPVCDLDLNYLNPITNVRTYGSSMDTVLKNTQIYVNTVQSIGMAACAKHFPGDGVDYRDQHLHPTYNSLPAEKWFGSYGKIYQNLIDKGLMSVMVGHIVQPSVEMEVNPKLSMDKCLPASLSHELLTGVLRERFGFNGLITTDATIMGGYCMAMERRRAIPASIMAGCDMLVFNTNLEEDFSYIMDALKEGLLTEERLDEAVMRILALKSKVCRPLSNSDAVKIEAEKWHRECADKAITLVKNNQPEVLPVTPYKYPRIRVVGLGEMNIKDGNILEIAKAILEKESFSVEIYNPFEDDLHGCSSLPKDRLTIYLANYEQASNQTVVRISWCKKHAMEIPRYVNEEKSIFVSLANPYNLQDIPRVKTYINAYTATKDTVELVLEKLMGRGSFTGVSPVDAFCGLPDTRL